MARSAGWGGASSERAAKKQDCIAVLRGSRAPRDMSVDGRVAGKVRGGGGKSAPLGVDLGAARPQHPAARLEELYEPSLAGPVHQRARGDLPESMTLVRAHARSDSVGVNVTVEPEHHVPKPQQQLEHLVVALGRPRVDQHVVAVMRQHYDDTVVVFGAYGRPVPRPERRLRLFEPPLEPVQLKSVDAPVVHTRGADGIQPDQP